MAALILAFLLQNAVPAPQAHAILAFATRESGISANPPASEYHCMFQWDRPRYAAMLRFTGARGGCPNWREQVSFMLAEATHPRMRCFWRARSEREAYSIFFRVFGMGGSC